MYESFTQYVNSWIYNRSVLVCIDMTKGALSSEVSPLQEKCWVIVHDCDGSWQEQIHPSRLVSSTDLLLNMLCLVTSMFFMMLHSLLCHWLWCSEECCTCHNRRVKDLELVDKLLREVASALSLLFVSLCAAFPVWTIAQVDLTPCRLYPFISPRWEMVFQIIPVEALTLTQSPNTGGDMMTLSVKQHAV